MLLGHNVSLIDLRLILQVAGYQFNSYIYQGPILVNHEMSLSGDLLVKIVVKVPIRMRCVWVEKNYDKSIRNYVIYQYAILVIFILFFEKISLIKPAVAILAWNFFRLVLYTTKAKVN